MSQITFDTLKFAKKLRESGVPDTQAEAQAEAFAEIFSVSIENLATKKDLSQAVEHLRVELSGRINLLQWMIGFVLAANVTMLAILIRLLMKN